MKEYSNNNSVVMSTLTFSRSQTSCGWNLVWNVIGPTWKTKPRLWNPCTTILEVKKKGKEVPKKKENENKTSSISVGT